MSIDRNDKAYGNTKMPTAKEKKRDYTLNPYTALANALGFGMDALPYLLLP